MIAPVVARVMSFISVGLVFTLFRMLLGWLDRRLAAPVMHEKINSASDQFSKKKRNTGANRRSTAWYAASLVTSDYSTTPIKIVFTSSSAPSSLRVNSHAY